MHAKGFDVGHCLRFISMQGGIKPANGSHDWCESGPWRRNDGDAREGVSRVGMNRARMRAGKGECQEPKEDQRTNNGREV